MKIAQYCQCTHCGDCDVVKNPGVLLQVEEGTVRLILQDVSIKNSGLYKVQIFIGNNVFEETGSLHVSEPFSPSGQPPHTSTLKPHNSSDNHWLYFAIIIIILGIVICGVVCFFRRVQYLKKIKNLSDCEEVSCRENTEDQLMDT
ncbi:hypothetical protein QQF64_020313 [Cirrhinus molitorella]|uniref:Uncharacterized protein n=1 Tax=Cirrhinus molitorella TaxID=172907 RepID=A0ABR3L8Y8_9TELE